MINVAKIRSKIVIPFSCKITISQLSAIETNTLTQNGVFINILIAIAEPKMYYISAPNLYKLQKINIKIITSAKKLKIKKIIYSFFSFIYQ